MKTEGKEDQTHHMTGEYSIIFLLFLVVEKNNKNDNRAHGTEKKFMKKKSVQERNFRRP